MDYGGIELNAPIVVYTESWTEFKKYITGAFRKDQLQYVPTKNGYSVFCVNNDIIVAHNLHNATIRAQMPTEEAAQAYSDYYDFTTNWMDSANKELNTKVALADYGRMSEARMMEEGIIVSATSGTSQTTKTLTFPYDTALLCATTFANWTTFDAGDTLDIYVCPQDGIISVLTVAADSGASIITITEAACAVLVPGDYIKVDGESAYTRVIDVDRETYEVLLEDDLTAARALYSDIYFKSYRAKNLKLKSDTLQVIGDKSFGGAMFPTGWELHFEYNHNSTLSQNDELYFTLAYYHGK